MVRLSGGKNCRNLKPSLVSKVNRLNEDDLKSIGSVNIRSSLERDADWPNLKVKQVRSQRGKKPSYTLKDSPHKLVVKKRKSTNPIF